MPAGGVGRLGPDVTGPLGTRLVAGIGAPVAAAAVWGRWVAPAAQRRLTGGALLALEVILFALGVAALFAAGATGLAIAFGLVYAANKTLSLVWGQ